MAENPPGTKELCFAGSDEACADINTQPVLPRNRGGAGP